MIAEAIAQWGSQQGAFVRSVGNRHILEWELAKRGTGGSQRNLRYRVELETSDTDRTVMLHETLWERHAGPELELAPNLHMRDETFRIGTVWERTAWETHSSLLKRQYDCSFDFANLRHKLEQLCKRSDYRLRQLIPV